MKLIRAKASISAVFAVLLTFFSMATYADLCQDCFDAGFNAGKNQCPTCATCPNCQEGDYDRGYTDGRNSVTIPDCQSDYNRGYTDGRNSVTVPNCQEGDYDRDTLMAKTL